jgi:hypothetical protein
LLHTDSGGATSERAGAWPPYATVTLHWFVFQIVLATGVTLLIITLIISLEGLANIVLQY